MDPLSPAVCKGGDRFHCSPRLAVGVSMRRYEVGSRAGMGIELIDRGVGGRGDEAVGYVWGSGDGR